MNSALTSSVTAITSYLYFFTALAAISTNEGKYPSSWVLGNIPDPPNSLPNMSTSSKANLVKENGKNCSLLFPAKMNLSFDIWPMFHGRQSNWLSLTFILTRLLNSTNCGGSILNWLEDRSNECKLCFRLPFSSPSGILSSWLLDNRSSANWLKLPIDSGKLLIWLLLKSRHLKFFKFKIRESTFLSLQCMICRYSRDFGKLVVTG